MLHKRFLAALPITAVALAACGSSVSSVGDKPAVSNSPVPDSSSLAAESPDASPTPEAQLDVAKFGQTVTYDDGLEVAATKVSTFKIDPNFASGAGLPAKDVGVRVTVQIRNKTATPLDATLVSATATTGADGSPAPEACGADSSLQTICGFQQSIRPGGTGTSVFEFAVAPDALSKVHVEVSPDFDRQPATFEGAVK